MTGQTVNWTSANTAVATVSGNGLVTAVSNGTSQITARSGNASGTANDHCSRAGADPDRSHAFVRIRWRPSERL